MRSVGQIQNWPRGKFGDLFPEPGQPAEEVDVTTIAHPCTAPHTRALRALELVQARGQGPLGLVLGRDEFREHEMGVRVVDEEGSLYVTPAEEG